MVSSRRLACIEGRILSREDGGSSRGGDRRGIDRLVEEEGDLVLS